MDDHVQNTCIKQKFIATEAPSPNIQFTINEIFTYFIFNEFIQLVAILLYTWPTIGNREMPVEKANGIT